MKGGELFERIEKVESFTEEDARTVIVQAAKAVRYLHENKIVHRDIKVFILFYFLFIFYFIFYFILFYFILFILFYFIK
jgi:serine/threonine protein kinase